MISRTTWRLVIAATFVNSFLAAGNVNRRLVEMPAWQQTGPLAWAAFSRHADLASTAMILHPLEAFAGTLLSIAAAVSFRRDRVDRPWASVLICGATLMGIGGLLATTQAAPVMLSVRDLGQCGRPATGAQRLPVLGQYPRRLSGSRLSPISFRWSRFRNR